MATGSINMSAHRGYSYAMRNPDQTYPTLQAMLTAALDAKNHSAERTLNLKDLKVVVQPVGGDLGLQGPRGVAEFTPWSFGQLCKTVGAPASHYARDLSPEIAAAALNYRIGDTGAGTTVNLLLRGANGSPVPVVRACTSDTYGRLWNADLIDTASRHVFQHKSPTGAEWGNAPTWEGKAIAGYMSDRDAFVLQIDGGSMVQDPSRGGDDGRMYRAIILKNSEVGACSVVIETILFRVICGNWMLIGAVLGRSFRRRHVGRTITRDTVRELAQTAREFCQRPASEDEALVRTLIAHEIAATRDGVIDELRKMGATREQAGAAYDTAEQYETVSPRSFWGLANGITRMSQASGLQSDRYDLDKLGALIMARGARVAA